MTQKPYIPPTLRLLSLEFDTVFCVSATTTDPYDDNGDYEWS